MENLPDELANLEIKHRREKKEFQAQVQALKKTAKNDKTKKKEVTAEIARLELEMEVRHKLEIETISKESEISEEPAIIENDLKVKLSKAQKRRDKKLQQEKEREVQIKEQELENLHGPRNTELQAINSKLKERNLGLYSVPSDGDCLYKAVSHQMLLIRQQEISVDNLRKKVADFIRQYQDEFIPFMSNPDTGNILSENQFAEYCDNIEHTKAWGGQLEIRALSNTLKCPITVIQATGPDSIEQGTEFSGPSLIITYHRHLYKLGEHYNSTIINDGENDHSLCK